MTTFDFLDPLEDIIVEQFEVLDENYSRDMAKEIMSMLQVAVEQDCEIRYVLIDGETGQLESRQLFKNYEDATNEIKKLTHNHCNIGTVICEL